MEHTYPSMKRLAIVQAHRTRAAAALTLLLGLLGTMPAPAVAAGPTISVTSAGAKGDGVADDTAAFQNALGQLNAAGGGTLAVPQGTYLVQAGAIAVRDNVTVTGTQATMKASTVSSPVLDVNGANITVSGLTIDGANVAVGGLSVEAGSTNVLISNDTLQDFTQPADQSNPYYNAVPVGARVYGNGNGITFDTVAVKNVVAVNTNGPSWPHKVARGIWIDPSSGQTISKNVTIKNGSFYEIAPKDDGDCIVIQDSSDYANLQVINNTFDRCHKRAIKIQVPGAYVANNTINNPFLGDNKFDTYPEANTFDMYSAVSAYASNVVITGNTVKGIGSFYNAIDMDAGAGVTLGNISIQGNNVAMGSGANLSASSLIRALVPVDELTVTNNQLSYATWGIRADGTLTRQYVQNNTISNVATPYQCATSCQAPYAPAVAIPAYFPPGAAWTQMDQGAPQVGIAVMNPANGPGASSDPAYVSQVQASQQAGLAVLGYVYTKYANSQPDPLNGGAYDRTIAAVEADVDTYVSWYHVDGIFLDEATNTCDAGSLSYYTTLVTYIKEKGGKGIVALNPGTATGECYLTAAPAADIVVTFEGRYSDYVASSYAQPSWVPNYSPARFWHLVYDTPDVASLQNVMGLVKQRGTGWFYATPQGSGTTNPWAGLPSDPYWSIELGKQPSDATPPTTSAKLSGTPGANGWYTSPVTVALSATDNAGGSGVKQITYSATGAQPIASTTVSGASATFTINAEGQTTVSFFATDNATNAETPKTVAVDVDQAPPVLTVPGPQTVQYSDALTFKVSATDADSGDAVKLSASGLPAGLTFADNGDRTGTVAGTVQAPSGPYTATFIADDGHTQPVSKTVAITVSPEGAVVVPSPSNPAAVKVASPGGASGQFSLSATVTEATDDPTNGDVGKATPVTVTLAPVGAGAPTSCTASVSGGGIGGTLTATCGFSNVPVGVYDVQIKVSGGYYAGSTDGALAVFDPSLGYVTGGGTLVHNGAPAVFALSGRLLRTGQLQGEIIYVERRPTGAVVLESNALAGIQAVERGVSLRWNGSLNGAPGYRFAATLIFNGPQATSDQFGLQVKDPSGNPVGDVSFSPINLTSGYVDVPRR